MASVSKSLALRGQECLHGCQAELSHPLRRYPASLVAASGEFIAKLNIVRHDNIAGLQIANHQAVLSLSQMERHQQAYTRIEAVLVAFVRRSLQGDAVDPLDDFL